MCNSPSIIFSFVNDKIIHRSGAVVLEYKGNYYLFGQDEGTYFGVQLPKAVNTLSQAYNALIPKKVQGKKYVRQGEWFVVSLEEAGLELPALKDCVSCYTNNNPISLNEAVILPREEGGNAHSIDLNPKGSYRIDFKNRIYAKGFGLSHDEHKSIYKDDTKWYTFYKNTALKSVSQMGVD